ncbi:MAG: ATP-dependent zinc metalloprotease FtsH [Hyphomicrobiaceae bacterium]|nr:ATP-dependent zinc metalloprotease FtsH [Hyphomicrobiaceae bacterium]
MNSNLRNLAIWGAIIVLLIALFNLFNNPAQSRRGDEITYSDFLGAVEGGNVTEATLAGNRITGTLKEGGAFSTYAPDDPGLVERLREKNVRFKVAPRDEDVPSIMSMLLNWFPMLLLIAVWIFFMRQMQSGSGRAMGFGKSRAKLLTERHGRVTFEDVAGVDEAKSDLQEIVEFLRDPQKFQRLGGRIPRGCLLVGPPGPGKTLIARAVAGEANVPFFTISGSDFVEMFVGVGASRVRDMFEQAKKNAPCIIFIDEIDAVGRHRGAGLGGGNDEREQTLNQLLVEMDGFEANEGIIIIAATNRPDVLDPALLRPGRFDRQIVVPNPDVGGREKILRVHMRKVPVAPDVDARVLARGTPGFSGADLANLVNEAALLAARRNKRMVTQTEFEDSKDKVMMGAERRSMAMTEEEKLATAYHEAGHAIVNIVVPGNDPLHKVTIIPRGRALGVTMSQPERDKLSYSKEWCEGKIAMAFGGRVAEQLVYGKEHLNTGASSDITQATGIAKRMVTEWGMSDKLGPLLYSENQQEVFLGHAITQRQNMSEETAKLIDEEVRRIVMAGYAKAWEVLSVHRKELEAITQALMEFETISGEECMTLMRGEKIVRRSDDDAGKGPAGSAVPVAGRSPRPREEPDTGGMEPQPQG